MGFQIQITHMDREYKYFLVGIDQRLAHNTLNIWVCADQWYTVRVVASTLNDFRYLRLKKCFSLSWIRSN